MGAIRCQCSIFFYSEVAGCVYAVHCCMETFIEFSSMTNKRSISENCFYLFHRQQTFALNKVLVFLHHNGAIDKFTILSYFFAIRAISSRPKF